MVQLSEFIWMLRSSAWVVFSNFLLTDATSKRKIFRNQKAIIFRRKAIPPFIFFVNIPFKNRKVII